MSNSNESANNATFEDNLAICQAYRKNIRKSQESLQEICMATTMSTNVLTTNTSTSGISIVNVERALTKFIAGLLGLSVDKEIFRGTICPGQDGCAVSVYRFDLGTDETIPTVLATFECRDVDRDTVITRTSTLTRSFPVNGMSTTVPDGTTVTARRISIVQAVINNQCADSGRIKTFGFVTLKAEL